MPALAWLGGAVDVVGGIGVGRGAAVGAEALKPLTDVKPPTPFDAAMTIWR